MRSSERENHFRELDRRDCKYVTHKGGVRYKLHLEIHFKETTQIFSGFIFMILRKNFKYDGHFILSYLKLSVYQGKFPNRICLNVFFIFQGTFSKKKKKKMEKGESSFSWGPIQSPSLLKTCHYSCMYLCFPFSHRFFSTQT